MGTLVTPSARSHEKVSGRWDREIQAQTRQEWTSFYVKLVSGIPITWVLRFFILCLFVYPFAADVSTWIISGLVLIYMIADRFSKNKEFHFFFVGSDVGIIFLSLICMIAFIFKPGFDFSELFYFKWILLIYLFAFTLELFPGLNKLYTWLIVAAAGSCFYAFIQHFMGMEWFSSLSLGGAPLPKIPYFSVQGLQTSPEALGTLLSMLVAFPISSFLAAERHHAKMKQIIALLLTAVFILTLIWTYRPGVWFAATAAFLICLLVNTHKQFKFLVMCVGFIACSTWLFYPSSKSFVEDMKHYEVQRSSVERIRINQYLDSFTNNVLLGGTTPSFQINDSEHSTDLISKTLDSNQKINANYFSNVYFEILAELGLFGILAYFSLILPLLLFSYRLFKDIPSSHYWHRVLAASLVSGQVAFHVAGLYWSTLHDPAITGLFAFFGATAAYMHHHYAKGLVSDDFAL